jgi:hypothetical protein
VVRNHKDQRGGEPTLETGRKSCWSCRAIPRAHPGLDKLHPFKRQPHWAPQGWGRADLGPGSMLRTICSQTSEIKGVIDSTVRSEDLAMGYEAHKILASHAKYFFFLKLWSVCASLWSPKRLHT